MHKANPVTWFSIPSDDIGNAARFYEAAFGWNLLPVTKEYKSELDYQVALNSQSDDEFVSLERGRLNGCLVKKQTGITHPVVLIEVDDLDEAADRVKEAGGSVASEVIPMDTLNGDFFLAKDPDGNLLEIFRSRP